MSRMIHHAVFFAAASLFLGLAYPPSTYLRYYHFGKAQTIFTYVIVALLTTLISSWVAPKTATVLLRAVTKSKWAGAVVTGVTALMIQALVSFGFGPGMWDVPGTRIRAFFFSEWDFLIFLGHVASPMAFLSMIVYVHEHRRATPAGA